jgi:DNA mismatch repair protein PMS2
MSPEPADKTEASDEEDTLVTEISRKRRAPRSLSRSPPRSDAEVSRSKNAVQMVLSTTGASWSLNKGKSQPSTTAKRKTQFEWPSASQRLNGKKTASALQGTLTQLRRGVAAHANSEEVDELIGDVSDTDMDDGRHEENRVTVGHRRVRSNASSTSSRGSRSSMRIDSPPDSPELAPENPTDDIARNEHLSLGGSITREEPRQDPSRNSSAKILPDKDPARAERQKTPPSHGDNLADIIELDGTERNTQTAEEVIKDEDAIIAPMKFDIETVTLRWKESSRMESARAPAAKVEPNNTAKILANEVVLNPDPESNPEELLSRVVQKEDFENMEILGQFNLGFIIVRSRRAINKPPSDEQAMDIDGTDDAAKDQEIDDLFIVDQHAADEKFNFETLQLTTRIESQKLIRPRPLDLSAGDRVVALENLEVLQSNGFEVEVGHLGEERQEDGDGDEESAEGGQLFLVSQPVSKSTAFDMSG